MNSLQLLREAPGLDLFTDGELEVLDRVLVARAHKRGTLLVREGASVDAVTASMFLLLAGEVDVSTGRGANTVHLELLGPGAPFGMNGLIDHSPRGADCRAKTDVVTAELTRLVFDELVRSHTGVAAKFQHVIARQLAKDLRHLTALVQQAAAGDEDGLRRRLGMAG